MPHAKAENAEIHYEFVGNGEPLMLVAGLGGAASYWQPNLDAFSQRYRVLLHDHRGTGKSTRYEGEYSVELMADDLLAVMDAAGIEKAHLVGHSTGGAIGQVIAAKAPERIASLVLYASWSEVDPQMRMCLEARQRLLRAMGEAEYHRATPIFLYPPYYVRDHQAALDAEIETAIRHSPPKSIMDARVTGILKFNGLGYLDKIRCPAMVLVAEDDILTPPYLSDQMAARLRTAVLVKLPRGAHALSRTEPELFNKTVLYFVSQHGIKGVAA